MLQEFRTLAGVVVRLRPATAEDGALLRALEGDRQSGPFALALAAMDATSRRQLLDMQHRARVSSYAVDFPAAVDLIVMAGDEPAGRILLATDAGAVRVVDIVLLHEWRGRGIGTAVMRAVIAGGLPVDLSVAAGDARVAAWYRRLGFEVVEAGDVYLSMRRAP